MEKFTAGKVKLLCSMDTGTTISKSIEATNNNASPLIKAVCNYLLEKVGSNKLDACIQV